LAGLVKPTDLSKKGVWELTQKLAIFKHKKCGNVQKEPKKLDSFSN